MVQSSAAKKEDNKTPTTSLNLVEMVNTFNSFILTNYVTGYEKRDHFPVINFCCKGWPIIPTVQLDLSFD